jgi:hypothetical protein
MAERRTSKVIERDENDVPTGRIIFTFSDDTTEIYDIRKTPGYVEGIDHNSVFFRQAVHGGSQKIGDSYAQAASTSDPLAFAKSAVRDMIAQLYKGEWRSTVEGAPRVNELAVAISRATGESLEDAVALVAELDDAGKKEWRNKAKIKVELAKIALEKQTAKLKAAEEAAAKEAAEEAAKANAANANAGA